MPDHDHYHRMRKHVAEVGKHNHICMIYTNREQQVTAVAQYLRSGLRRGERCLYIGRTEQVQFINNVLTRAYSDIAEKQGSDSLIFSAPEDIYFIDGRFLAAAVMYQADQISKESVAMGFTGVHVAAEMSWALHHNVSARQILEYECQATSMLEQFPVTGLCQYDANRFHPEVLRLLIETHPSIIYDGQVIENPDYVAPAEFMSHLENIRDLRLAAS